MNATAALPMEGASVADQCLAKIKSMLAPYSAQAARRVEPGEALWTVLTDRERAFILKMARLDSGLAAQRWIELPDTEQAEIVTAWERLVDWVHRVQAHRDAVRRRS